MHFSKNTLKLLFWAFQMILSTFGFSPEIPFLRKLHKFQEYEWKMITKQSDIIDKTFGYLLRGEIWLDNVASKNEWYNYKSSSQRDPLSLSPPARHHRPSLPAPPCPSLHIPAYPYSLPHPLLALLALSSLPIYTSATPFHTSRPCPGHRPCGSQAMLRPSQHHVRPPLS